MRSYPKRILRAVVCSAIVAAIGCKHARDPEADGGSSTDPDTELVYVSTGSGTIHVLALDLQSGQLSAKSTADGGLNPTYMAFSRDNRFAYAVNEANQPDSQVLAFAIDPSDGHLTELNRVLTGASGAPHLAVHPSGKWLAVAHYGRDTDMWVGGQTVVIPIEPDGSLGEAGASSSGPADRSCVNAHQVVFARDGKHVLVPCLGSDYVAQYRFDAGALSLNDPAVAELTAGVGPRHLALGPGEKHAYLVTELGGTLVWFDYDADAGLLSHPQSIDSTKVPKPSENEGWSAHVVVHPSGKWLYTSNRMEGDTRGSENSIGVFKLERDGTPTPVPEAFVTDGLATSRDFTIDPTGRYLIATNQAGDQNVLVFRIDRKTGALTRTQAFPIGGQPAFAHALVLP
jgi:6-phosphogluconolactonase